MNQQPTLSHADAQLAIQAIRDELTRRGHAASISVADVHGELIAFLRMDGASLPSATISMNKAFTAARTRRPSRDVGQSSRDPQTGFDLNYYGELRYVGWGGGLPVRWNGQVIGAVGVSSLPETEDMEVCQMGVDAITTALPG